MCPRLLVPKTSHLLAPNGKTTQMGKRAVSKGHSSALKEREPGTVPPPTPRGPDPARFQLLSDHKYQQGDFITFPTFCPLICGVRPGITDW